MKTPIITLVAASIAITASPAIAGPAHNKITVEYQDLNLATEAGVERLEKRIDFAAERACQANTIRTGTRTRSTESRRCVTRAKAQAMQQFASVIEQQRLGG